MCHLVEPVRRVEGAESVELLGVGEGRAVSGPVRRLRLLPIDRGLDLRQPRLDLHDDDASAPEISGLDVYRELERERPEILDKLVFMTGGEFSRKGPRLPSGARIRRLEKPFSLKDLRALVREARRQA